MKFSKIFPILALCLATFSAKTEAQEYWRVTYWPASQDTILNGVFQTGRDTSYVVGNFGKILKFTPQELSHQVSGVNTTLNAVHFPSKTTGFVAGDQGVFLRTTNGGNSWTLRSTGTTTKNLYSVFFVNPNVGYAVGDSGLILKTTNAGANWASQTWGNGTRRLSSVHATSPDTAFVAGWDGTMLRTTDGGATWIALGAGVASFRSMWFPTSLVGYAIGSSSDLVKTTDGGDTWSYLNGLSVAGGGTLVTNVTSVHFPTRDTGYVVGGGSSNVLQTTDGGATWKVAGPLSGNFAWTNGVFFSDQLNGVAVGGHRVFQHGYTPPVSPELYLPAAGATDVSLNLNLTWEVNPAASTFHLQVSTNINFSSMVFEDSTLLSATAFLEELSTSTTYYWRLRAKNPGGTSDWSDARSFTTVPPIPPAPNLTTPVSGATTVSVTPALSWGAATGAVTYNLQVSTQSNFSSLLKDTVTALTGKTLGQLANNTTHYWRVSATNAGGTSAWSTASTFTTVPVPAAPDLSDPALGAVNIPLSTTLNWDASANALTYRVQVSTSNTFGTTVVNDSTITGTSRAIGPLLNNTTYFWRVNAKNGGASDYSATFSFTTLPAPPAAPVLESPAADLLNAPLSLDLMWGASSGAVTYTLELSTDQTFATVLLTDSTLTGRSPGLEHGLLLAYEGEESGRHERLVHGAQVHHGAARSRGAGPFLARAQCHGPHALRGPGLGRIGRRRHLHGRAVRRFFVRVADPAGFGRQRNHAHGELPVEQQAVLLARQGEECGRHERVVFGIPFYYRADFGPDALDARAQRRGCLSVALLDLDRLDGREHLSCAAGLGQPLFHGGNQ
jgi:photosystem II stability/assembly factor-like uncharacterized protein